MKYYIDVEPWKKVIWKCVTIPFCWTTENKFTFLHPNTCSKLYLDDIAIYLHLLPKVMLRILKCWCSSHYFGYTYVHLWFGHFLIILYMCLIKRLNDNMILKCSATYPVSYLHIFNGFFWVRFVFSLSISHNMEIRLTIIS